MPVLDFHALTYLQLSKLHYFILFLGSIAELSGVQIGDRLVFVNGTNVVKASQETLIDIIKQS